MSTTSPHLTLEELTSPYAKAAEATDTTQATEHLIACDECAAEAASWAAVAAGVQLIVSRTEPPSPVLDSVWRAIETDRRGMRRQPVLVASAAAAALVLAAGGYGLSAALGPGGQRAPARTQVAADLSATGCSGLDITKGTLQQVTGHDLVLTVPGGATLTITTSASTTVLRAIIGRLGDIADGEHVLVLGSRAGGAIVAGIVAITPSSSPVESAPAKPGAASGTVVSTASGGFDVVTTTGTRVRVTTSSSTKVSIVEHASLGQLQIGEGTSVVGTAEPDGTLAASTVTQGPVANPALPQPAKLALPQQPKLAVPPRAKSAPGNLPIPGGQLLTPSAKHPFSGFPSGKPSGGLKLNNLGCAPEAIATSYLLSAES
jgi:hypothetical protein